MLAVVDELLDRARELDGSDLARVRRDVEAAILVRSELHRRHGRVFVLRVDLLRDGLVHHVVRDVELALGHFRERRVIPRAAHDLDDRAVVLDGLLDLRDVDLRERLLEIHRHIHRTASFLRQPWPSASLRSRIVCQRSRARSNVFGSMLRMLLSPMMRERYCVAFS